MTHSRRAVLRSGAGALALGALAGCLSEPDGDSGGGEDGYASFFALADWSTHVVGDEMEIENPIETGEMGHGWEPPVDLQREIAESQVFIYLDSPEFAWAQDVAADLEAEDVALIDALEGLESQLLPVDRGGDDDREPEDEYDDDPAEVQVAEFEIYDRRTGEEVGYWHGSHWHGGVPDVVLDQHVAIEGVFEDEQGRVLPLGEDEPFRLEARIADGADPDVLEIEPQGDHVELHGAETGRTMIIFELVVDDETVWDTSEDNASVAVVEESEEDESAEFADPHVWVDPVLAQEMVETIATGLGELDPDNAELYEENAAEYTERMAEVDQQFEELAENATREVAVIAGHDSFQYIEERYGFELHTPVGVSPDAVESSEDISELIGVVEEHDIDTILYDPFETQNPDDDVPQMVDVLLDETDATDSAPITAAEGTTQEWNEQGYGWIEQMEEINVPSFSQALGAE
ncbi:zinc ABC transporter substrate-binding protein [Natronococcus pandeyae]|uniref:Zinc ABC transporter substrate-binding protein n=1 Tax=Natronococcus pandeyae TaxID=2055836 RepID=A0A8J8TNG7_9EURY|nr:zinc ABC transporter substrate-binding protein [Natronococcus pandeyae]TYL36651.1 zinc ABC transporter substrate-binding protein [Natronococcus pandeyae]